MSRRLEILWNVWANSRDLNAQSLTARELARRLPAERFHSPCHTRCDWAAGPSTHAPA